MYFYAPSKDKPAIPFPVADISKLSFCYYNNLYNPYYYPQFFQMPHPLPSPYPFHLGQVPGAANPRPITSELLNQPQGEQAEGEEESECDDVDEQFVSAEGKELQKIAAEKFKNVNGWVPRELMFRTKMCSFFYHTGKCAKGDRCNFSHTFEPGMEVPAVPPKKNDISEHDLRTKPCKFYFIYGRCSKGDECNFSHDPMIFLKK